MSTAALRFWLDYCERAGATFEQNGDQALVLLPPELQAAFGLPEETAVTADPDVAAEGGALLLSPGHPALERAAAAVLAAGDAGHLFLAWPRPLPPSATTLLARARERLEVEHGRIDAAGEALAVFLPLVRVLALATYAADQQFQELEEVWADGRTGAALPPDAVRSLAAAAPAEPAGRPGRAVPVLAPQLEAALRGAQAALDARAVTRGTELAREAQGALRGEAERAEAYYAELLTSLARRRESAAPERQPLLDAQAAATRSERARRLAEISAKAQVRHELRPVRLHLVLVPALHLPVDIRRGERRYAHDLVWLLPAGAFAPVVCPHCGGAAPLVAGRERLGCRTCLARPISPGTAAPPHPGGGMRSPGP